MEKNVKKDIFIEICLVSLKIVKFKQYYDKKSKHNLFKYD